MEALPLLSAAMVPAQAVQQANHPASQVSYDKPSARFYGIYQQFESFIQGSQQTGVHSPVPGENVPVGDEFNFLSIPYASQPLLAEQQKTSVALPVNRALVAEVAHRGTGDITAGAVGKHDAVSIPLPAAETELPQGSAERNPVVSALQGNRHAATLPHLELRVPASQPSPGSGEQPVSGEDYLSQKSWTTSGSQYGMPWTDKGAIQAEPLSVISAQDGRITSEFRPPAEAVASKDLLSAMSELAGASQDSGKPAPSVLAPGAAARTETAPEPLPMPQKPLPGAVREVVVPQTMMPRRLGSELIQMLRTGESGLDIRLDPPELGRLSLSVSLDAESLSLQVTASSAVTRDLLLGQAEKLRQVLADQNLTLSALSVDIHSGKGGQENPYHNMNRGASETLLVADWGSDNPEYLSAAQRFRSGGGRLLDYFV